MLHKYIFICDHMYKYHLFNDIDMKYICVKNIYLCMIGYINIYDIYMNDILSYTYHICV